MSKSSLTPNGAYKFDPNTQRLALEVIRKTGNRQAACDAVGINLSTFSRHLRKDPTFRECYIEARAAFVYHLEDLALKLAEGTIHTKPGPGGVMYDEIKYHPTVLLHLLKVNDREKHGDKKETTINHNHTQQIGIDQLTKEQRDQLQAIILSQLEPADTIDVQISEPKELDTDPPPEV